MMRRRAKRDAEIARDIAFHLDTETEDNIARGMPPEDARAAARRKFGNRGLIREEVYHLNTAVFLETIWRDILYALRSMRKNPAFAVTAILTLALGIGGNTAIFSVIRAVLLKPLEYRDPDRLVHFSMDIARRDVHDAPFSVTRLEEIRTAAKSFAAVGAYLDRKEDMTLSGAGDSEAVSVARASANFLDVLGVHPIRGRGFLSEEDAPGATRVVMISEALWRRRFGADPHISGKAATLDAISYVIVGVLPEGFAFPHPGMDAWVPRPSEWSIFANTRYWRNLSLLSGFARLRPGVTLNQAGAEMEVLNQQFIRSLPGSDPDATMRVMWLKDRLVTNVRPMLWTLFGAVGFVLLIACANVASLMLARATSRSREFAVRASLGAGRGRLVRQLLAESLLLSTVGGGLGVLLAWWSLSAIPRFDPRLLPRAGEIRLDGMVLGFTLAISIVTGVLFGLFPSLQASRPHLADVLRDHGTAASGRRGVLNARGLLVVSQVALSIVLLIGAALLMRSFARLHNVDPGFRTANLLTMKIGLPPARYDTDQKKWTFFQELVGRVEALPGVRGAAMAMSLPTTTWIRTNITSVEGQPGRDDKDPLSFGVLESVTPGYFQALGIPVRRGREFTARDNAPGAPPVMIVNEKLAHRLWPEYPGGPNPLGKHVGEGSDKFSGPMEVVGIVADTREGGLAFDTVQEFYVPAIVHPPQSAYLAVRADGDPMRLVNPVRAQLSAIDRDQSITDVKTMETVIEATLGQRRLTMLLLEAFAGSALLLAVVGIYGVIAYSVAQRTQEVGIRRALGAQQSDILRLVLGQGLRLALAGVVTGIGGAFALTRLMKGLLFQVSATDPATFVGIALLFVVVALVASFIPARRAARIDPMESLRV